MKPTKVNKPDSEGRFVLDGNALYEIDEKCVRRKRQNKKRRIGSEKKKVN